MPDRECFHSSVKDKATDHNGKTLDGHKNNKDYLTRKIIWNKFNIKNIFERRCFVIS